MTQVVQNFLVRKIRMMHHIDLSDHVGIFNWHHCQLALLFLLSADTVCDDGNTHIQWNQLLYHCHIIHLNDDIQILDAAAKVSKVAVKQQAAIWQW